VSRLTPFIDGHEAPGGAGAAAVGNTDTIASLATPPGRSALAMIRISGSSTRAIASRMLHPVPTSPRRATFAAARNSGGETIDQVIATLYVAPHSFTGEDLLDISTHGGLVAPTLVLAAAISAGARLALPGEFTRRAVLNGKLDLLQAEAIGDLIEARSSAAAQLAMRQLDGGLSRRIVALREQIIGVEALLAYDIDFPDEDDGPLNRADIVDAAESTLHGITSLLATGTRGALIHDGALVVLAGATNVGKSSLFNALLGEARAIVTDVPGTTRDAIEAILDLPGWPLRLVDTAGLRETTDVVERLGIETAERYLARAQIIILCVDTDESFQAALPIRRRDPHRVLIVATKGDLVAEWDQSGIDVSVSAYTGSGLAELLRAIEQRLTSMPGVTGADAVDAPVLTQARHHNRVATAASELQQFLVGWRDEELPASVAATHIRAAARAMDELIGDIQTDDVLDAVFRRFCVGK